MKLRIPVLRPDNLLETTREIIEVIKMLQSQFEEEPTWHDINGELIAKTTGAGTPTMQVVRTNARAYAFAAGDSIDTIFHIPHDYVEGTDVSIHVHWTHSGTSISGSLVLTHDFTYQSAYGTGIFPVDKTLTQTILTPSIALIPQFSHRSDSVPLSVKIPTASLLGTNELRRGGMMLVKTTATTIPTIAGSAVINRPYLLSVNLHYQSSGSGTTTPRP